MNVERRTSAPDLCSAFGLAKQEPPKKQDEDQRVDEKEMGSGEIRE